MTTPDAGQRLIEDLLPVELYLRRDSAPAMADAICEARAYIERLRGVEADARRYLWLLDNAAIETVPNETGEGFWWKPDCNKRGNPNWNTREKFNGRIDAAIAASRSTGAADVGEDHG